MERRKQIAGAAYQQEQCANYIMQLASAEGLHSQKFQFDENGIRGTMVQVLNTEDGFWSGVKKITGLKICAMLKLVQVGDDLEISVEAGHWIDKVALGAIGVFVVCGVVAITAGIGAWRQSRLLDRVYDDALGFFAGAK